MVFLVEDFFYDGYGDWIVVIVMFKRFVFGLKSSFEVWVFCFFLDIFRDFYRI